MVEELKPHVLKREISVKADLVQIAFRKLREVWPPVCSCSLQLILCAAPCAWLQQMEVFDCVDMAGVWAAEPLCMRVQCIVCSPSLYVCC